jgi:hypothetical protein
MAHIILCKNNNNGLAKSCNQNIYFWRLSDFVPVNPLIQGHPLIIG